MDVLRDLWYSFRYCRTPSRSRGLTSLLAASRLCVAPMTMYSVSIGGLLAFLQGSFDPILFTLIMVGFVAAHILDNIVNDLSDYMKKIDVPGYFRTLYGPHPFIDGILSVRSALFFALLVAAYNSILALYLSLTVTPLIGILALAGAAAILLYAGWPIDGKSMGLGEVLVAIVWGPVMAGGTLLALAGHHPLEAAAVYMPFAATVSLVLIGKHLDKIEYDSAKGVGTLPVRLGERPTRVLSALIAVLAPLAAAWGVYIYTGEPLASLVTALIAVPSSVVSAVALYRERPAGPPEGWRVWPLWSAAWGFIAMDSLGRAILLSLLLAASIGSKAFPAMLAVSVIVALMEALRLPRLFRMAAG